MVDVFIFHDDLQFTKGDWRNRNQIKTPTGIKWLSIPCGTDEHRLICEVELKDNAWQARHWAAIQNNYAHSKYFNNYQSFFKEFYLGEQWRNLSVMNQHIIVRIAKDLFGVSTQFEDSRKYSLSQRKAERVKELLQKTGATEYVSGPSAKNYLSEDFLEDVGIKLIWMNYDNYPEYPQLYPPFAHQVSVVDLIFNTGQQATKYMKSFRG
jgi:hypothetical protein